MWTHKADGPSVGPPLVTAVCMNVDAHRFAHQRGVQTLSWILSTFVPTNYLAKRQRGCVILNSILWTFVPTKLFCNVESEWMYYNCEILENRYPADTTWFPDMDFHGWCSLRSHRYEQYTKNVTDATEGSIIYVNPKLNPLNICSNKLFLQIRMRGDILLISGRLDIKNPYVQYHAVCMNIDERSDGHQCSLQTLNWILSTFVPTKLFCNVESREVV